MKKAFVKWNCSTEAIICLSEESSSRIIGFLRFDRVTRLWSVFVSTIFEMGAECEDIVSAKKFSAKNSAILWLKINLFLKSMCFEELEGYA